MSPPVSAPLPLVIPILGMTSTACAARVERAIGAAPGVVRAEVSFANRSAKVTLDDAPAQLGEALTAITSAGYEPAATAAQILARRGAAERAARDRIARSGAARDAVLALAIAALQMLAGMNFMAQGPAGVLARAAIHPLLRPAELVATLVVMAVARTVFVQAWAALRQRTRDMNMLVALGSGTAFIYSAAVTLVPSAFAAEARLPDVYFDAASSVLAFMLLGRALEGRAGGRSTAAIDGLETRRPASDGSTGDMQQLADRLATHFLPAIAFIASASAAAWGLWGPEPRLAHALFTFVAVVVVSCPCALALAAPTAIATAVGRAARLGIVVRSGEALERAAQIDTVAIDKTGPLTEGVPELVELTLVAHDPDEGVADAVLRLAAAVERGSEHPVGRAILAEAAARGIDVPSPGGFVASAGAGARAEVEGQDVRVGSIAWLASEGIGTIGTRPEAAFGIAVDGHLRAYGLVADRLRDEAHNVVARLHAIGIRVVILTSDREDVARAIAAALGVDDFSAELGPEEKRETLDRMARDGRHVAMCSDGIFDAPALARARVGIAIGSGTGAAVDAADITLLDGGLARLPDTLELARASLRVVRQNVRWALACNAALLPLAAGAHVPWLGLRMPPALAAAAMAFSSVGVVLNSLRLRRFGPR